MPLTRINIGPVHPSTHGVCRLVVDLDGDTIVKVEPHCGFLHRGVEKLVENRMFMQCPPYMEKLDYVAPMSVDELYVSTVEKALGVEVKEPAAYARLILLELQRLASHLFWFGATCNDLGQMFTGFMWGFRDRDIVLKLLEEATGQRMFYVNMRLGGLVRELPPDFAEHALSTMEYLEKRIPAYRNLVEKNPIFNERMKGVGKLSRSDAIDLGVAGPVLRASGVPYDVRKDVPYYAYSALNFRAKSASEGDNFARYMVRMMEMQESIRLVKEALRKMPEGSAMGMPIKLIIPKAKNRIAMVSRENPRGEEMMYLVADPEKAYRLSIRAPTFINLAALNRMAEGCRMADLFAIFSTLDLVMADVDR